VTEPKTEQQMTELMGLLYDRITAFVDEQQLTPWETLGLLQMITRGVLLSLMKQRHERVQDQIRRN
jgi:hypothetical protein